MTAIQPGAIVIHRPPSGTGSGPYYVEEVPYGYNPNRVKVSLLTPDNSFAQGLPATELEVVGHFRVDPKCRDGYAFPYDVLMAMQGLLHKAKRRLDTLYP